MVRRVAAAMALCAVALAGAHGSAQAGGDEGLFVRAFESVRVLKDGERHPLFADTSFRLKLRHEDDRDVATWRARCNNFGAPVAVRARRLRLGLITGTAVGCEKRRHRQDRWLTRFLGSDPRWSLDGRALKLAEGTNRIVLERRR